MKKYKNWFYIIGAVFVMCVIFYSSSQPYGNQDMRSEIGSLFDRPFWKEALSFISFTYAGSEVSVEAKGVAGVIEFFLRKFAHLFVFFCLGFFTIGSLRVIWKRGRLMVLSSFLFVVLYALLDEMHQFYTGDRTPLLQDVLIDSIGGALGIFFFLRVSRRRSVK
ncbi:MAG: VanZ family protein [Bacillus sp. (in: firmicutes)]